jgi:hypothetical protein
VAASDIPTHREMLGEAALYIARMLALVGEVITWEDYCHCSELKATAKEV